MRVPAHRVAAEVSPLVLAWVRRSVPVDTTRLLATGTAATGNTSCPRPVVPPIHRPIVYPQALVTALSLSCHIAQSVAPKVSLTLHDARIALTRFPEASQTLLVAPHSTDAIGYCIFSTTTYLSILQTRRFLSQQISTLVAYSVLYHIEPLLTILLATVQHCQAWFTSLRY